MVAELPKTISIMGRVYQVREIELEADTFGEHDYNEGVIDINTRLEQNRMSTLLHEVLHGIIAESGLKKLLRRKVEEALVVALENGLMQSGLIKD